MSPGDITSWMIIIIASPHNRKMRQKFETFFFVYFHPKIFPYRVRVDQSICSGCVFTSEIKLSFITARMLIKCFFFFFSLAFFSAVRRQTRIESLLSFTLWPLNYFLHWGQTFPEISKKPKKENFCRGNEKKKFNAEKFAGMTSASSWWLVDNIFLHSEQTKCAKFYGKIFVRFFSSVTQRIFFFHFRFDSICDDETLKLARLQKLFNFSLFRLPISFRHCQVMFSWKFVCSDCLETRREFRWWFCVCTPVSSICTTRIWLNVRSFFVVMVKNVFPVSSMHLKQQMRQSQKGLKKAGRVL